MVIALIWLEQIDMFLKAYVHFNLGITYSKCFLVWVLYAFEHVTGVKCRSRKYKNNIKFERKRQYTANSNNSKEWNLTKRVRKRGKLNSRFATARSWMTYFFPLFSRHPLVVARCHRVGSRTKICQFDERSCSRSK